MKTSFLMIVAGMAMVYACQGRGINCDTQTMNKDLEARYDKDQEARKELMPILSAYQEDGSGQMKLVMRAMKMDRIDKKNQKVLDKYLNQCGWPGDLSDKGHKAVFMILQHADDALMNEYFPLVKERVQQGYLESGDWAAMYDRLKMNANKPQRFGTQTFQGEDNLNWVWPIENVESLQTRRDSVNLPDMETYFSIAKDSVGVVMMWNKELTIEDALRKD